MRRILILISLAALAACKPEPYLGPLDSPIGNWKAQMSKYYFDGEQVHEAPECTYSAISFYKDSLCCIEGVKGTFNWSYSSDSLIVDTIVWRTTEFTGRMMTLDYLGVILSEEASLTDESDTDGSLIYEYNETVIYGDGSKFWYMDAEGQSVPCFPLTGTAKDGSDSTLCWWNTRSDSYIPF